MTEHNESGGPHSQSDVEQAHCERRLEELYAYLDAEVSAEEAAMIRRHVADCDPCAIEEKLEQVVRQLLRRSCVSEAPVTLRTRIVQEISVTRVRRY